MLMFWILRKKIIQYFTVFFVFSALSRGGNFLSVSPSSVQETFSITHIWGIDLGVSVYAKSDISPESSQWELDDKKWSTESKLDFIRMLERILKILYLILRPLLAIAGASMDNSLVYGSMFYLDTMLWKFRQIIRTFANFTIWFLFIASILASFVGQKIWWKELKDILKSTFIAWVLVQMSRWILAVLLDLSTIWVIALWWLPLSVLQNDESELANLRFVKMYSIDNFDIVRETKTNAVDHNTIYGCEWGTMPNDKNWNPQDTPNDPEPKKKYFLPCWINNNGEMIDKGDASKNEPLSWEDYKQQFVDAWTKNPDKKTFLDVTLENISDNYCVYNYDIILRKSWEKVTHKNLEEWKNDKEKWWIVVMEAKKCSRLSDLINTAEWMSWPFFTLFASMMHMGNLPMNTNTKWLTETSLMFLLKVIIGLALIVPLFALAVVLVVRAVFLWIIIAFSPLLTLMYVYKFSSESMKLNGGNLSNVSEVLWLIFMPVFVMFAVSLSLIFLNLIARPELIDPNDKSTCKHDAASTLSCIKITEDCDENDKVTQQCYDVCGITTMCFKNSTATVWTNILNVFGRSISSFFGIALMWMLVFAALKTSKFTENIVNGIEWLGKMIAKTVPIIPVPWLWMQSIGTLWKTMDKVQALPQQIAMNQRNESDVKNKFDRLESKFNQSNKELANNLKETAENGLSSDISVQKQAKQQAEKNINNMHLANGTSYEDVWEKNVARNYALASGIVWPELKKIEKIEDALKHKQVINHLIQNDGYHDLMDRLNKTTSPSIKRNLIQAIKSWLEWNQLGNSIKKTSSWYSQLYKFDAWIVEYITDDATWQNFKAVKSYAMWNNITGQSDKKHLEALQKLIAAYGGPLPSWWPYSWFIAELKRQTTTGNTATIGKYEIEVKKSGDNIIAIESIKEKGTS